MGEINIGDIDIGDGGLRHDVEIPPSLSSTVKITGRIVLHFSGDARHPPLEDDSSGGQSSSDGSLTDPGDGEIDLDDDPVDDRLDEGIEKAKRAMLRSQFDPSDVTVQTSGASTNAYWTDDDEIAYEIEVSPGPKTRILRVSYDGPQDGGFHPTFAFVFVQSNDRFKGRMQGPTFHFNYAPEVELTASPTKIDFEEDATIDWSLRYHDSATIDNGIGSVSNRDTSTTVSPDENVTYTLTADGPAGSRSDTASVSINPPRIDSFTADSTELWSGNSTTLHWQTTNADSVELKTDIAGNVRRRSVSPDGSTTVTPREQGDSAELIASGPGGGPKRKTLTFNVNHRPSANIWAEDTQILKGNDTRLHWRTDHAHDVDVSNVGNDLSPNGDAQVSPANTTTYRLTGTGDKGSKDTDSVTVHVKDELRETTTLTITRTSTQKVGSRNPVWIHEYILNDVGGYLATHGIAGADPDVTDVTNPTNINYAIVAHESKRNSTSLNARQSTSYFDNDGFAGWWGVQVRTNDPFFKPSSIKLDVSWEYRP